MLSFFALCFLGREILHVPASWRVGGSRFQRFLSVVCEPVDLLLYIIGGSFNSRTVTSSCHSVIILSFMGYLFRWLLWRYCGAKFERAKRYLLVDAGGIAPASRWGLTTG